MKYTVRPVIKRTFAIFVFALLFAAGAIGQSKIDLKVDATEAGKGIVHVFEKVSVRPGRYALFYPKWIPGEHSPTGPLNNMINLRITANGKPIKWERDNVEMFAFWCDIPKGVTSVDVAFDDGAQWATTSSASLARIKWNRLLLYPRGVLQTQISVTGSLKFPSGWQYATALPVKSEDANEVSFSTVNLETFIDSPAIIGKYFKKVPLTDSGTLHEIDIAADSQEALEYKPETLAGWKELVRQAHVAFGAEHYKSYRFLLTLSDMGGSEGLEHHQSSEDGVALNAFKGGEPLYDLGDLLGHEYAHSWNGKYRRPAGLATPDFEKPQSGELLWVYEGLTQYLGYVLPTRSGLWSQEVFRETIADTAAQMVEQSGRNWRPLVDTARAVQFTYPSPRVWMNQRRRVDYYFEGSLIWLEADVLIRTKTNGKKSLDDFFHVFHGGANTGPMVKPYTFNDVVAALNTVMPYDWAGFLRTRVYEIRSQAPLNGITMGGWKLEYSATPNIRTGGSETVHNTRNYFGSIGISVDEYGTITDLRADSPAAKAGLAPNMRILAKDDKPMSLDDISAAITAAVGKTEPIVFTVDRAGEKETYSIDYHGGLKYAHLVRDNSVTDVISEIGKPR